MTNLARGMGLGLTTLAVAAILAVAFLWVGPGADVFVNSASAAVLFDEQQVVNVYERVSPAVVEVITGRGSGRRLVRIGSGSGFLIDTEGHIVTNNHVVEGAGRVKVKFSNGTTVDATITGRNPANDLALLKVDASAVEGIDPVVLGDSAGLKPGQLAIAIGNPFGLDGSITVGVISQLKRDMPSELGRPISNVIQTDALINPGNSGGPLLDSSGAVVGINTAIQVSPTGLGVRGVGFAVPVDTLELVLPRLKAEAVVRPPLLGIQAVDIDAQLAERLGLPVDKGVYVIAVGPDTPAEESGLIESGLGFQGRPARGGDIIISVGGASVNTTADLVAQLNYRQPGDKIILRFMRGNETLGVVVTLAEWTEQRDSRGRPRFERGPIPDSPEIPTEPFDRFFPWPFPLPR